MASEKAISGFRDIKVTFTTTINAPFEFYKAALRKVRDIESRYNQLGAAAVPDLTAVVTTATGAIPSETYQFNITSVMLTGVYTLEYTATLATP